MIVDLDLAIESMHFPTATRLLSTRPKACAECIDDLSVGSANKYGLRSLMITRLERLMCPSTTLHVASEWQLVENLLNFRILNVAVSYALKHAARLRSRCDN